MSNLIYAIPNLAIEIIENSSGSASESNINDWIVAKLSAAAITSDDETIKKEGEDKKLQALEKLNNPSVKQIHTAISFMVGNYTSKKVLEEVAKLSDEGEKIKLLRLWLKNNKRHKNNLDSVLNVAFELLIKSSSTPTSLLDALKDLSFQLRNLKDNKVLGLCLKKFMDLSKSVESQNSKTDYYVLMLNIFYAQNQLREDKALHLLDSLTIQIDAITDSLVRLEAYCEVFQKLKLLNNRYYSKYYNRAFGKIKYGIEEIRANSADHKKIFKTSLEIISKVDPKFGLEICRSLNTSYSRDRCRLIVLDSYLDNSIRNIKTNFLKSIIGEFENKLTKELGLSNILDRYSDSKTLPSKVVKDCLYFINFLDEEEFGSFKLSFLLSSLDIISKNNSWWSKLSAKLKSKLNLVWNGVESEWDKIDVGFLISSEMSVIDPKFAKEFFDKTYELKKTAWLDSNSIAETYINCLRLVVRSFTPLLKNELFKKNDLDVISGMISRVPSEIERLQLWTELSLNAIAYNQIQVAKVAYENTILPIVQANIDKKYFGSSLVPALIIVHYFNSILGVELIKKMSLYNRETACEKLVDFYLTGKNPFELYEGDIINEYTTYDNIYKAISLLDVIETDNIIFIQVCEICKISKDTKRLSNTQRNEIANKLNVLIQAKLPDSKNIQHDGYKILCEIQTKSLKINPSSNWVEFYEKAKLIDNLSDRIFVNANLLDYIPFEKIKSNPGLKGEIFDQVIIDLNNLNSQREFADRILSISKIMYVINQTRWKVIVTEAFSKSYDFEEGPEMYEYQRDIIDMMYKLDRDFSKTLVNKQVDPDSFLKNKKFLKDYYEMLEVSKKVKNNETIEDKKNQNQKVMIRAVSKALGSLNSKKIGTKKISDVSKYLSISKDVPLADSLPIYMFFLANSANINLTKNSTSQITKTQRDVFTKMVEASSIVEILSQKRKFEQDINKKVFIDNDFIDNLAVPPGTRDEALTFIREWIADEVEDYLIICDPYFNEKDLAILKMVKEVGADFDIDILASKDGDDPEIKSVFRNYWSSISDESPPYTNITFAWLQNSKTQPIHDRWVITKNSGLRLGTSFNSLGQKRESEISILKPNSAFKIKKEIIQDYLSRKKRDLNSERIDYVSFNL